MTSAPIAVVDEDSAPSNASERYAAFITYSTRRDYRTAQRLEAFIEGLHRLRLPPDRAPLPAARVFVDSSDLPGKESLKDEIARALAASKHLVVLCSPEAAEAPWVEREIRRFLGRPSVLPGDTAEDPIDPGEVATREGRIVLAVTAGDPDAKPGEVFPALVRHLARENTWFDLRGVSGGRPFDDERLRLACNLLDRPVDEIAPYWWREEAARRRRATIFGWSVAAGFLVLGAFIAYFAWQTSIERDRAVESWSKALHERGEAYNTDRMYDEASVVLAESLEQHDSTDAAAQLERSMTAPSLAPVWRTSEGMLLTRVSARGGSIAAIDRNGRLQSSTSQGRTLRATRVGDSCVGFTLRGCSNWVSLSSRGDRVATATDDGAIRVMSASALELEWRYVAEPASPFVGVTWSDDDRYVVAASLGAEQARVPGQLWVIDASSGRRAATRSDGGRRFLSLAVCDGRAIVGEADGSISRWRLPQLTLERRDARHQSLVSALSCVADGSVLSGGASGRVLRWRWDDDAVHEVGSFDSPILSMVEDGDELVVAVESGALVSIDASGRRRNLESASQQSISLASDGDSLLVGGDTGFAIHRGSERAVDIAHSAHGGPIRVVAPSPTRQRVATGGMDRTVRVWSAIDGAPQAILWHPSSVRGLAWRDEDTLAVLDDGARLHLWSLASGDHRVASTAARPMGLALDTRLGLVFVAAVRSITAYSLDTLEEVWTSTAELGNDVSSLAYAPGDSGGRLAVAAGSDLIVLAADSGAEQWRSVPGGSLAFFTGVDLVEGYRLHASGAGNALVTYQPETSRQPFARYISSAPTVFSLDTHSGRASGTVSMPFGEALFMPSPFIVRALPMADLLLTTRKCPRDPDCAESRLIDVWATDTRQLVLRRQAHASAVTALSAWSLPDGSIRIGTGSVTGAVAIWQLTRDGADAVSTDYDTPVRAIVELDESMRAVFRGDEVVVERIDRPGTAGWTLTYYQGAIPSAAVPVSEAVRIANEREHHEAVLEATTNDGGKAVVALRNGTLVLIDVAGRRELRRVAGTDASAVPRAVAWLDENRFALVRDRQLEVRGMNGRVRKRCALRRRATQVVVQSAERVLYAGGDEWFELNLDSCESTLRGSHRGRIWNLLVTRERVVSIGADGSVRGWRTDGELSWEHSWPRERPIALAASSAGVVVLHDDGTLRIVEPSDGRVLSEMRRETGEIVRSIRVDRTGRWLSVAEGNRVRRIDLQVRADRPSRRELEERLGLELSGMDVLVREEPAQLTPRSSLRVLGATH